MTYLVDIKWLACVGMPSYCVIFAACACTRISHHTNTAWDFYFRCATTTMPLLWCGVHKLACKYI